MQCHLLNAYLEGSKVDTDNSVGGVGRERLKSPNFVGALHERVDQRWVRSEGGVDPENNKKKSEYYSCLACMHDILPISLKPCKQVTG